MNLYRLDASGSPRAAGIAPSERSFGRHAQPDREGDLTSELSCPATALPQRWSVPTALTVTLSGRH